MVDLFLDRTDAGSLATILVGDTIVLRVNEGEAQHWVAQDIDALVLDAAGPVAGDDQGGAERVLRFRAMAVGRSTLRLVLLSESAGVVDTLVLAVEVNAAAPASGRHLLRKRH